MKIIVTGGHGFIGSNFIKTAIKNHAILDIDKITYAANPLSLKGVSHQGSFEVSRTDICDYKGVKNCFDYFRPDAVVHFAAESHVDRSITNPKIFLETNVLGTCNLLQIATEHHNKGNPITFIHVSTDEVYGSLGEFGYFTEDSPTKPNSPYAASKAASDCFVNAFHKTYGLPTIITHCSNNFGPQQQTEKFIPTVITKLIKREPIPIYGKGRNIRDWIYVQDHVNALISIIKKGKIGETYNIGANQEWMNLALAEKLCDIFQEITGIENNKDLLHEVTDRPGHDFRYAIDSSKIKSLGWECCNDFHENLKNTVKWYIDNKEWWK